MNLESGELMDHHLMRPRSPSKDLADREEMAGDGHVAAGLKARVRDGTRVQNRAKLQGKADSAV